MRHLFKAFIAKVSTANHQQRGDSPGGKGTDYQCQRDQNGFVKQRTFGDRPDNWQFAVSFNPAA